MDVERCPPPPTPSGNTTHCFGFADIGYSCVHFDACIFGGFARRLSIEERQDLAEIAICESDDDICCHESEIDKEELAQLAVNPKRRRTTRRNLMSRRTFQDDLCEEENQICCPNPAPGLDDFDCKSDVAVEKGLGCHTADNCVEGSEDQNGQCDGESTKIHCCVEKVRVTNEPRPCEEFKDQHFECTRPENCETNPTAFCPRAFLPEPEDALFEQANQATCPNGGQCCHLRHHEEHEECGSTDSDFSCVRESECIDDAFPELS